MFKAAYRPKTPAAAQGHAEAPAGNLQRPPSALIFFVDINTEFSAIIAAVGLESKAKKYPSELSGGEMQRAAIARALAKRPKVLFADEPTGALDETTGRQVLDYIAKLQREFGLTVVMVTHNRNIADMADSVIELNSGRVTTTYKNAVPKSAYEIGW
ncbi:MAG TPA: ATP-binding cassette domain-containing protein [Candidatus Coproplasma stercoripullorum]|uniref:ATP-binding cassette domain-containing protein n=1 Tax=Candidatus Coproplasma stercoripullorum TaxID=2840751 RepID=A0A9D1AGF4_9FIRM|nr:ATP-binding cassette domain-containing protein [Candidatus Coproplasma stercoripullorum]